MHALLLILYVAAGDLTAPTTVAFTHAIEEVVGPSFTIEVRSAATPAPDDRTAWQEAAAAGAAAVASIGWTDAARSSARIHVALLSSGDTLERTVAFRAGDSATERGRALGFIVGSFLVPPTEIAPEARAPAAPQPDTGPLVAAAPHSAPPPRFGLDVFMAGAAAVAGQGDSLGGGAGVRWPADRRWGARLGARVRVGSLSVAQASLLNATLYLGLWTTLLQRQDRRFSLGARVDAHLVYESLTHFSSDDPEPVREARLLPGGAAALEGEARLTETAAAFVAAGGEAIGGSTTVVVHQRTVATLVPFRLLFEAGFRARF